jgi:alpha-galactosidase
VIAIDQDSLGVQGFRSSVNDSIEVWVKPLANDDWAVCLLNRSVTAKVVDFDWSKQVITDDLSSRTLNTRELVYAVRDVWLKKNIGDTKKRIHAELASHDVLTMRLAHQ